MLAEYYQRIQLIMAHLGYYQGEFDGIWGPDCVAAKRKWELEDDFEPAAPNNGLPFRVNGKVPKGLHWGLRVKGLTCAGLTEERIQELLKESSGIVKAADIARLQKPVLDLKIHESSDLGLYHKPEVEELPRELENVSEPELVRQEVPDYLAAMDQEREAAADQEEALQEETEVEALVEEEIAPQKVKQPWTDKKRK